LHIDVNAVLEAVRRVKVDNKDVVRAYRNRRVDKIVEYARRVWKYVITYRYEDYPLNYGVSTKKLVLSSLIAERFALRLKHLWKHLTIAIIGLGGAGKTTYSVLSMYGAYKLLGYSDSSAYRMVATHCFFEPLGFVKTAKELVVTRRWSPSILVDDVGSQISKYWIFMGQMFWAYLFSVMDQLKDWTGVLILTARRFNSIPSRLREITDIVVEAKEIDYQGIILDIFFYYLYDDYVRGRRDRILFIDVMPPTAKIPDELWNKMLEIRRSTGIRRLGLVEDVLSNLPQLEKSYFDKIKKKYEKLGNGGENAKR